MDGQGTTADLRDRVLQPLEDAGLQRFHFRTWLTAGMGFFTDAYDLFIIGVVTTLLVPLWHLSTLDLMLLNSTALFAAVLGALIFGRLMDRLGRKAIYGIEAVLLTAGALLSAFSTNIWMLLIFRFIVGLGVGGDYPMSGVIMSEYSNRKRRGFLVNAVFAMQGFGLLVGPAVAALLLAGGVPDTIAWRLMLGFGAIPAAVVIYLRRRIAETPHFTLVQRFGSSFPQNSARSHDKSLRIVSQSWGSGPSYGVDSQRPGWVVTSSRNWSWPMVQKRTRGTFSPSGSSE